MPIAWALVVSRTLVVPALSARPLDAHRAAVSCSPPISMEEADPSLPPSRDRAGAMKVAGGRYGRAVSVPVAGVAVVAKEGLLMKKINNRYWKARYVAIKVGACPTCSDCAAAPAC